MDYIGGFKDKLLWWKLLLLFKSVNNFYLILLFLSYVTFEHSFDFFSNHPLSVRTSKEDKEIPDRYVWMRA